MHNRTNNTASYNYNTAWTKLLISSLVTISPRERWPMGQHSLAYHLWDCWDNKCRQDVLMLATWKHVQLGGGGKKRLHGTQAKLHVYTHYDIIDFASFNISKWGWVSQYNELCSESTIQQELELRAWFCYHCWISIEEYRNVYKSSEKSGTCVNISFCPSLVPSSN